MAEYIDKEEQKWIPIGEELPKVTGWYYVTFETYSGGYMVREMFYRKSENYWTDTHTNSRKVLDNDDVVAWMPLPEPYKIQWKMEREEELEQTIDELNYDLTNAFKKIKRLESSLKRARAEIESTMNWGYATGDDRYAEGFEKSLKIIDKYREMCEE